MTESSQAEFALQIATSITAFLVALIHFYIFMMESVLWGRPKINKIFGVSQSEAVITKKLAFNQGFYNLFLSIAILIGLISNAMGRSIEGQTLIDYAVASVMGAGIVLLLSSPHLKRGASVQIFPALIYFILRLI